MCCGNHMTGRGGADRARKTLPTDECILCAEKHLATARALDREARVSGYVAENRADILGELCLAQWHSWHKSPALAEKIRAIRHLVQMRKSTEVDWSPALAEMDMLASAEASKIQTGKQ